MDDSAHARPDLLRTLAEEHRAFLAFLERRVGEREAAADILQAAFVRAAQHVTELRDQESVTAWFYRLLRNGVADHHRARGRTASKLEAFARELDGEHVAAPDTRDAVCRCVGKLLGTLKPEHASALREVELDGLSVKAYAAGRSITANAAGVRLFRARKALRERVIDCCGVAAVHDCADCRCD